MAAGPEPATGPESTLVVRNARDLEELLQYVETLQQREHSLIESVRILRKKYHNAKAENQDLLWKRLAPTRLAVASDARAVETADRVGVYDLREAIGRGATASVREAADSRDGRRVAVKIVRLSRAGGLFSLGGAFTFLKPSRQFEGRRRLRGARARGASEKKGSRDAGPPFREKRRRGGRAVVAPGSGAASSRIVRVSREGGGGFR